MVRNLASRDQVWYDAGCHFHVACRFDGGLNRKCDDVTRERMPQLDSSADRDFFLHPT